jgi:ubiquinol oxidase
MLERERSERPGNAMVLGLRNFIRESRAIALDLYDRLRGVDERQRLPGALGLTLDDDAVAIRERKRDADTGYLSNAPWISRAPYQVACRFLDWAFPNRPIARFWFLETVARMPYFSYLSVLHLYETFNWLHVAELRRTHFAEEWNELHHLLIMSALGGDAKWSDRFLAYHLSIVYYWLLVVLYIFSPRLSYNFSELLEKHAVDTYSQFLVENEAQLKTLPAPDIAIRYYKNEDAFAFSNTGFTNGSVTEVRRPPVATLYDVFQNICLDEEEHVKTMEACQDYDLVAKLTSSPYLREPSSESSEPEARAQTDGSRPTGAHQREEWNRWADAVNRTERKRAPDDVRNDSS